MSSQWSVVSLVSGHWSAVDSNVGQATASSDHHRSCFLGRLDAASLARETECISVLKTRTQREDKSTEANAGLFYCIIKIIIIIRSHRSTS